MTYGTLASPQYQIVDLGTLGGTTSYGFGINANGLVTGYSYISGNAFEHAFVSNGSTMTDINTVVGAKVVEGASMQAVKWRAG